jgi:hypothetical protein
VQGLLGGAERVEQLQDGVLWMVFIVPLQHELDRDCGGGALAGCLP